MVDWLPEEDGLVSWDWEAVKGQTLTFDAVDHYCIGEDEGTECEIPEPETPGTLQLAFQGELVDKLAFRALEEERTEFSFITLGDNDDTDCSHETFSFQVTAPVIQ